MQRKAITIRAVGFIAGILFYAVFLAGTINGAEFTVTNSVIYKDGKPFFFNMDLNWNNTNPSFYNINPSLGYSSYWKQFGGTVGFFNVRASQDITELDNEIERAGSAGLYSVVNLNIIGSFASNYLITHPQAAMLGPTGSPLSRYGTYPCFLDEGFRAYLTDKLRSIAGHFKDNPWFCGYFLQDEFSCLPTGDYNSKAIDVFRDKMMEQYGTIQALNQAWATNCLTRAQIQPPLPSSYTTPPGMPRMVTPGRRMADWQWFRRWAYLDFLRVVSQAIKEVDPNHLVINSMDWWANGTLNPTAWWDVPNYVDVLMRHGISYTMPHNFLLIRQIAESSGKAGAALCMPPGYNVPFNEFRILFDSARPGLSYVCPAGPEASVNYKGPADLDDNFRRRDPQYTTAKGVIQLGKVLEDNYLMSRRRPARVGFFLGERAACIIGNINYVAAGILNLLEDINVDYDILSEYNYEPLSRYDALIIGPGLELASNDLVNKVKDFKSAGKSLILMPYAFSRNESNEIVSVSRFPLNQRYTNTINALKTNYIKVNERITPLYPLSSYTYDTLSYVSVNTGDTVVARTTNGIPCGVITENGKVLILGWELGWNYAGGSTYKNMTDDYGGAADTGTRGNLFKSIYATNLNSLLTHDTCVALTPQKEVAYLVRDFLASINISPCVRVNGYEAPGAIDAESFIITNSTASNILIGIANRLVKPGQSIITTGWDMDKYQTGTWPQDYHIPITNAVVAVAIPGNFSGQLWAYQMPNTEVNGNSISAVPKRYAVNVVTNGGQREAQFTIPVIYDWRALLLTRALNRPLMGIQLSDRRVFGGQSCTATVSILNSTDHPLTGNLYLKDVHGLGAPTNTFSFNQLAPGAATNAALSITVNPSAKSGYYSLQAAADFEGTNASSVDIELYVPCDSTVVNWPLNEGSNCIISDLSGNLNHGTLRLGTGGNTDPVNAWVDGRIKTGIHFDGVDDFIEHNGDNIVGGLNSISVEAWIYPEKDNLNIIKADGDAILLHAHTTAGAGFCLKGADGTASGYINYKPGAIKLGKWNYIVGTWDGNKMRLYVNCELQGERSFNGGASGKLKGSAYFQAGSSYGSEQAFQGKIDEVKVHAKALSADAIRKNYDTANKVGEWRFDEGSGRIAKDTSVNGFDGTLTNMNTNTCWTNGVSLTALKFNGVTNGYVNCGDNPKMKGMQELTVEAWVKGNSYKPYAGILSKYTWHIQQHYLLGYFQGGSSTKLGKFSFFVAQNLTNGDDRIQSQANLDLNTWYHIAGVFKGGQYLKLYVNGVLNANKSTTVAQIANGNLPTWIGQYASYPFDGLIDEVKVYAKALSDEEIQNDYLAGHKVGEWRFNEGSGGTAKDTSGNGFDGTLSNMNTNTCWTNGVSGTALKFNGTTNGCVDCGDDPKSTGMSELTVEAWVKGNSYKSYAGILSKYTWHIQQHYMLGFFENGSSIKLGKFSFFVAQNLTNGDDRIQSQANLDLNKWYHIVGVFKGGQYLKLYVNGVLNTNKSTTVSQIASGALPTMIGQYASYPFDGLIDEVKVYSKALSDEEIRQDYLAGDKVGEWKFDEGSGRIVKDTSGNGFDGTLLNMDTNKCWTNGASGTALKFDGATNGYVNCGDNPKMKGMPELTVEAWVKGNSYKPYAGVLSKYVWRSQQHYMLGYFQGGSSNKLGKFKFWVSHQLTTNDEDMIQSQANLDLNTWYHIAGVFKGGDYLKLYVNGVLDTNKSTTVSQIASGALPTMIGQYARYPFDGLIDEVKVHAKALSDEEIRREYLAGVKVGEWRFDEGSGRIAKDTSGNGFDGTLLNMDTNNCWTDGASGTALKFDGATNGYVNCGDNPKMKGMSELTVEAWVKGNTYKPYAGVLSKYVWRSQQHYMLGYFQGGSSNKLGKFKFWVSHQLTTNDEDMIQSQANLDLNTWYHIAGVFKGGDYLKLYVNGVLDTNKSTTVSQIATGALPTWIGQYARYPFDGLIDEVKVYAKALSAEEIWQDFSAGTNSDGGNSTNTPPPPPPPPPPGGTTNIYSVFAADFDGDAKADPVIYCQTNGDWAIKLSASDYALTNLNAYLGGPGYTALAADFDGDALADPCVYKAAASNWLVRLSSAGYTITNLADVLGGSNPGGTNYVALAGDFDGDAKADPCVYRAATGTWITRLSAFDYITVAQYNYLGGNGYTAMAIDFDGDGLADPAVYYDSMGYWAVLLSAGEYIPALLDPTFGSAGWIAVPADFDGDHYADPAIFQLSTGAWLIKLSSVDYIIVDPFF